MTDLEIAKKYISKINNAEEKGHEFSLTLPEFTKLMRRKTCFFTRVVINDKLHQTGNARTLDRLDNSKGYVTGNVVACTFYFNRLKAVFENPTSDLKPKQLIRGLQKLKGILWK